MRLFLSSYFKAVSNIFADFMPCAGKKVVFIPTASQVESITFYVETDRKILKRLGMEVLDLDISICSISEIRESIETCDCVFVEGGNTFYLLQEMRRSGADQIIREHIERNKVYVGVSAGSILVAKDIRYARHMDDPLLAPGLNGDFTALGMVDFYIVPHYTNVPFKRAAEQMIQEYASQYDLYPIRNNQVVVVDGDKMEIVTV